MEPRYIAFDEPTAYLDPAGRRRVLAIIRELHREGIGVLLITHDPEELAGADRVLLMDQGRILFDAPPGELFASRALPLPPVADLLQRLRRRGWPLADGLFSVEEACRALEACREGAPGGRPKTGGAG